jgi:hypothetical protein
VTAVKNCSPCWGAEAGEHHYGEEIREAEEAKAERLVSEGLAQAGWRESDLELRRKADGGKVELAHQLRQETKLGWLWIAQRLRMGTGAVPPMPSV